MGKTGRTGAQNGRVGGRIGSGVRSAKALAAAPRVRVVADGPKPSKRARLVEPTPGTLSIDQLTAAQRDAEVMAASLGLSPGSTKIMVASALGTFAGSAFAKELGALNEGMKLASARTRFELGEAVLDPDGGSI